MPSLPTPISWTCAGETLTGMLHQNLLAEQPSPRHGVIMIPGGHDYRTGSHRVYVRIAEALAARGMAVLRADMRGMGDSSGHHPGFEHLKDDITSAYQALKQAVPSVQRIFLWGQCDSASAILLSDIKEIAGAILINPWLCDISPNTSAGMSRHYAHRLLNTAAWGRLLRLQVNWLDLGHSLYQLFRDRVLSRPSSMPEQSSHLTAALIPILSENSTPLLLCLGKNDATGALFHRFIVGADMLDAFEDIIVFEEGDHSFSKTTARTELIDRTSAWMLRTPS